MLHDVGMMDLALLTYLGHFGLNLRLLFNWHTGYRYRVDLLMRLPVPFVESREVDSMLQCIYEHQLRIRCIQKGIILRKCFI